MKDLKDKFDKLCDIYDIHNWHVYIECDFTIIVSTFTILRHVEEKTSKTFSKQQYDRRDFYDVYEKDIIFDLYSDFGIIKDIISQMEKYLIKHL
jgi:hypothetical protein